MRLTDFSEQFIVGDLFLALKEHETMRGWETEFWYLTKLDKKMYRENEDYVFPSKLIYYYNKRREELNKPNPEFKLNKKVIINLDDICDISINNKSYNLKIKNSIIDITKMSFYTGNQVERKMNNMAQGNHFRFMNDFLK